MILKSTMTDFFTPLLVVTTVVVVETVVVELGSI